VDRRLFGHSLNSPVSQAVLYLHESIYYTARMAGHKDSRPTRAAVSALINRAPIDSVSLLGLLQRLQMPLAGEGDNLLSAKAADFFQAELKKLNASLGKRAEKENRAFVRRYNAWVDNYLDTMYFHTIDTGGGNNPGPEEHLDAAYAAMERGLRDWHGSPQETIKSMCRRRRSGCEALGISLYRDMHQAEEKMRQDAAAALLRITRESFFPQIDRLGQFDAATKTAAKAAIEQSIQAGQMNAKNYQDDAEFGFFFDDKQSPAQKLRELHFMIP
jgi:hypothetical protein